MINSRMVNWKFARVLNTFPRLGVQMALFPKFTFNLVNQSKSYTFRNPEPGDRYRERGPEVVALSQSPEPCFLGRPKKPWSPGVLVPELWSAIALWAMFRE